jgi:hypothetical protein
MRPDLRATNPEISGMKCVGIGGSGSSGRT